MGASRPWMDAMEALTGQREMSTRPLLNYFRPLQEWLEKENSRNREFIGWQISPSKSDDTPSASALASPLPKLIMLISVLIYMFDGHL